MFSLFFLALVSFQSDQPPRNTAAPLPDQSLTPEEYARLGLPALEKPWRAKEYELAASVLEQLKDTPEKLPRFNSPASGKVFAKITDTTTLDAILNQPGVAMQNVIEYAQCGRHLGKFLALYSRAAWPKHSLAPETVELQATIFHPLARVIKAVNAYALTLDKTDAKYPVRERGLKKSLEAHKGLVIGSFVMFSDRFYATPADRKRLAKIYHQYLPDILKELPAELRQDLLDRFERLTEKETDAEVKAVLAEALKKMPKN